MGLFRLLLSVFVVKFCQYLIVGVKLISENSGEKQKSHVEKTHSCFEPADSNSGLHCFKIQPLYPLGHGPGNSRTRWHINTINALLEGGYMIWWVLKFNGHFHDSWHIGRRRRNKSEIHDFCMLAVDQTLFYYNVQMSMSCYWPECFGLYLDM